MSRSIINRSTCVALALFAGGALLSACGGGGEEASLVRSFFQASRFGDRSTLGNMSMVFFDPQEDGIASSPSVESMTEEQRRPLRLRELAAALEAVRAEENEFRAKKKAYQDENFEAITRVIEAEREGNPPARRDEAIKAAWDQWVDEERAFARKVSGAQSAVNDESRLASASVYDPSNPINVAGYEGELISKDLTVTANVSRDDTSTEQTMVITIQKTELQGPDGMIEGRWIITAIE